MSRRRRVASLALLTAAAVGCGGGAGDDATIARGRGLVVRALPPATEAAVDRAAVHAAFDASPALILMLHPRRLPRTTGMEGGDSVPAPLVAALRAAGIVRGVCEPRHEAPRDTPHCATQQAGYVIRVSPPLALAGDTLELYFAAEAFGPEHGARQAALRFEKIYQLVPDRGSWRVAREARVHDSP